MEKRNYNIYKFISLAGILALSFYPLYMGVKVAFDMIAEGTVAKENYPKYVIPYTPIAVAVIIGLLLMPLFIKLFGKYGVFAGSSVSIASFFWLELLLELKVVVSSEEAVQNLVEVSNTRLADWQMYMCAVAPPSILTYSEYTLETSYQVRELTPVDILIGEYDPAFKLHFYIISVVIILSFLNCLYGFARVIKTGIKTRLKALVMQSASAALFLGLCILACFTSFWRDGRINVSPLSAFLMCAFFIVLGVTAGIFAGSFLLEKKKTVASLIPAAVASAVTLLMYAGELILLKSHLYRFGSGFFFEGLPGIVLAPVDLLVIIASGAATFFLMRLAASKKTVVEEADDIQPAVDTVEEGAVEASEAEEKAVKTEKLEHKAAFLSVVGAMLLCAAAAVVILMLPSNAEKDADLSEDSDNVIYVKRMTSADEYYGLDASKGLDVIVWQMAKDSYSFGLMEHSDTERDWLSVDLMRLLGVNAEKMREILSTYDVGEENIYVVPWQNPLSSYIPEYSIMLVDEYDSTEAMEEAYIAKRAAYIAKVREMLFG